MNEQELLKKLQAGDRVRYVSREISGVDVSSKVFLKMRDLWIDKERYFDNETSWAVQNLVAQGKVVEVNSPGMVEIKLA